MIAKTIEYEDYNGNKKKETFHFHLSEPEINEMNYSVDGGLQDKVRRIVEISKTSDLGENEKGEMIGIIKDIILRAYGEKTADGRFLKKSLQDGHPLRYDFEACAAFPVLYMELFQDDKAAADFVNGIYPEKLRKAAMNG